MTEVALVEEHADADAGIIHHRQAFETPGTAVPNVLLERFVAREDFQFFEISPAGSKTPWLTAAEGSPLTAILRDAFNQGIAIQAATRDGIRGPDGRPAALVRQVEIAPFADPLAAEPETDGQASSIVGQTPAGGKPGTYETFLSAHTVIGGTSIIRNPDGTIRSSTGGSHYFRTADPDQAGGYVWLRLWHQSPLVGLVTGAFQAGRKLEVTVGYPFNNLVERHPNKRPAATIKSALVLWDPNL